MEVKEVVQKAVTTFAEVYPEATKKDLRLEEVFLSDDELNWLTTVSYKNPDYDEEQSEQPLYSDLANMLGRASGPKRRIYKQVKFRADSGKFIGITNG